MQVYSKNSFINYRRISSQIHNAFYIANKYKEKHSNKTVVIAKNWDYFIKDLYKYDEISYEKIPKHNSFEATEIKIKEIKNNDKSATIFTSFLENNQENLNKNNYVCYFNSGLDLCIWKIE